MNSAPTANSLSSENSRQREVLFWAEMMKVAEARQATIGQMQPKVYLPDLLKNRSHDFVRACHRLMLMPRETGESAFPDLATFVTVIKRVAGGRTSQAQQERRRENEIAEKLDRKDHSEDDTHVRNIYADVIRNKQIKVPTLPEPKAAFDKRSSDDHLNTLGVADLRALTARLPELLKKKIMEQDATGGNAGRLVPSTY